ncbi:hypothetical protein [Streptomyces sp. NPDC017529]|uniref:hypothetical protein n=1 Tax=Streptomyces sp. NPDC017529 TaxID=3365000 RepID=UPI003793D6B7
MPMRTATALGVLTLAATAVLTTTGTAAADSNGRVGSVLRDGRPGPDGRVGQVGRHGRFGPAGPAGYLHRPAGRDVGAVDIGKHTNAPSTASHNWGGGNWNSKVTFGDMILD